MDTYSKQHPKKLILKKKSKNNDNSQPSSSKSNNIEGTFIPLSAKDSVVGPRFFNPKFNDTEDDGEECVQVIDPQTEEKEPLMLLFPDLENNEELKNSLATMSTTQVTQMLVGQKADFSLLKASKKLNNLEGKLPPLREDDLEGGK